MNKGKVIIGLILTLSVSMVLSKYAPNIYSIQRVEALTGEELNIFNLMTFDNITTSVNNLSSDKAEIIFKNIDLNLVTSVNCDNFQYEEFTERVDINKPKHIEKAVAKWEKDRLIVEKVVNPGIYTGNVVFNFNNNTTKVFKISFIKKPSDVVTYKAEVKDSVIKLTDVKLNNEYFNVKSALVELNNNKPIKVNVENKNGVIEIPIPSLYGNQDNFNKCVLGLNYGDGEVYSSVSEIFIEKSSGGKGNKIVSSNGSFRKTTLNTGEIIITGEGLVKGSNVSLSVPGGKAELDSVNSQDNRLVFKVKFDNNISSKKINWTLDNNGRKLNGIVDLDSGSIESVTGNIRFENNENTKDTFKVIGDFVDPAINRGSKIFIGKNGANININEIKLLDLDEKNGNSVVSQVSEGKFRGKYYVSSVANKNPLSIKIIKGESTVPGEVNLFIDANFIKGEDYKKVTTGKIEYREKEFANNPYSNWVNSGVTFKTGENGDIKEEGISKTVKGLSEGKEYEFRVVYTYLDNNKNTIVTSNIYPVVVTYNGSSNSNSNSNSNSTTVVVNSNNTTCTLNTININLPENINFDKSKNPVVKDFVYKDKKGNLIKQHESDYRNVKINFENGKLSITGLVPGKQYEYISIDYVDNTGKNNNIVIQNPFINAISGSVHDYLSKVYEISFGRMADEAGYTYHLNELLTKKTRLREFLLNMLCEREFLNLYKTPELKIEALYKAIVGRNSDDKGKKFWISEYEKVVDTYNSEEIALKAITDRMINEPELEILANKMDIAL